MNTSKFRIMPVCYFFGLFFREMVVFNQGDPIYHSKMLSFFRKENFDLEAVYANPVPFIHVPQIGKDRLAIFIITLLRDDNIIIVCTLN
jgi:hypothetical protein